MNSLATGECNWRLPSPSPSRMASSPWPAMSYELGNLQLLDLQLLTHQVYARFLSPFWVHLSKSDKEGCHHRFWIYPIYKKCNFTPFLGTKMHFYHITGTTMYFYLWFWHFFLKKTMEFPDLQELSGKQWYDAINHFTSLVWCLHCTALHCSEMMWRTENYRFQLSYDTV